MTWILSSEKLSTGTGICNSLDNNVFEQFLNYAFIKTLGTTEVEKEKVIETIQESDILNKLDKTQLNLVIKTITYIIRRSLRYIMKSDQLRSNLVEIAKFNSDKADIFAKFWVIKTKYLLEGIGAKEELVDVQWDLSAELASTTEQKSKNCKGDLKLGTADNENIKLELCHDELSKLYSELENIQDELDVFRDTQS